ncbi:hypothetical protein DSUL_40134 [Desulfovibrionales bacterium]
MFYKLAVNTIFNNIIELFLATSRITANLLNLSRLHVKKYRIA